MAKSTDEKVEIVSGTTGHKAPIWETYQKEIMYGVGAIALIFLGYWGYKKMIVEPRQAEAVNAMWKAEAMFDRDSFSLALNNPGPDALGFLGIIDEYSGTPAGDLANYYASICYLKTGDYDNAIKYMEDYDGSDEILGAMKYGMLGDLYSEKQDFEKAIKMYEKATKDGNNEVVVSAFLKKLGLLNEKLGNKEAAVKAYERLRKDYPNQNSSDWREIEKYIYRAGGGQ